ncbi:hypothetical protein SAY86_022888 [Trapa natans]|uniref:Uncharacterized protein n=1 Tax=Trapa natans TaxID=22666 RepID=A0AAN7RB21_TRANT|nr:hypothetical protein SAY86_022888 [Trapa natans]
MVRRGTRGEREKTDKSMTIANLISLLYSLCHCLTEASSVGFDRKDSLQWISSGSGFADCLLSGITNPGTSPLPDGSIVRDFDGKDSSPRISSGSCFAGCLLPGTISAAHDNLSRGVNDPLLELFAFQNRRLVIPESASPMLSSIMESYWADDTKQMPSSLASIVELLKKLLTSRELRTQNEEVETAGVDYTASCRDCAGREAARMVGQGSPCPIWTLLLLDKGYGDNGERTGRDNESSYSLLIGGCVSWEVTW